MNLKYSAKHIVCLLTFQILLTSICFSGGKQKREALVDLQESKKSISIQWKLDSAIQAVSKEIEVLVSSTTTAGMDSVRLQELGFKLSFLTTLENNLSSQEEYYYPDIIQDGLGIAILIFGFLITLALLVSQRKQKSINYVTFKLLGIVFIGTVSVFLIPAGFDNNQITPIVGLLGTLAGYLIGSSKNSISDNSEKFELDISKTKGTE